MINACRALRIYTSLDPEIPLSGLTLDIHQDGCKDMWIKMITTMLKVLLKIVTYMFDKRECDLYIPRRKPHVRTLVLDNIF